MIEIEQSQRQKRQWYFLGILPGAWAIVGSRWGSYLPSEPIFFSDLFIALLIISSIFSKSRLKRSVRFSLFVFLIFFLSFQLLIADWNQPITTIHQSHQPHDDQCVHFDSFSQPTFNLAKCTSSAKNDRNMPTSIAKASLYKMSIHIHLISAQ